jgi:hypothetical protein
LYTNKEYPPGLKIEIPLKSASKALRAKDWVDERLASVAAANPYLRVCYEDFLQTDEAVLKMVWRFLGCDVDKGYRDVRHVQRQSKGSAADYVLNYGDLVTIVRPKLD